jgi:hypothetical protein
MTTSCCDPSLFASKEEWEHHVLKMHGEDTLRAFHRVCAAGEAALKDVVAKYAPAEENIEASDEEAFKDKASDDDDDDAPFKDKASDDDADPFKDKASDDDADPFKDKASDDDADAFKDTASDDDDAAFKDKDSDDDDAALKLKANDDDGAAFKIKDTDDAFKDKGKGKAGDAALKDKAAAPAAKEEMVARVAALNKRWFEEEATLKEKMKKQREDERMRRRCIQLAAYEAENGDQGEGRSNAGFYVDWSDSDNGRGGKTSSESDDGGAGRNLYD